jgi:hypothetical protein
MLVKGQSVDYVAIRAEKKVPRRILEARTHLRKEVMNLRAINLWPYAQCLHTPIDNLQERWNFVIKDFLIPT